MDAVNPWPPRAGAWLRRLELLLVFATALRLLAPSAAAYRVSPSPDVVRQLLLVRDCLEADACHLRLATRGGVSVVGLYHGAAIIHLETLVLSLGGDLEDCKLAIAVLSAIAAALLYALARADAGRLAALAATAAYVALVLADKRLAILWNPPLAALPPVLYLAACRAHLQTGRARHLLVAGAALGVGFQVHLATLALLPAVAGLVIARPRGERLATALLVAFAFAAALQLGSPSMVVDIARPELPSPWLALAVAAGLAGVVWLAWTARWVARGERLPRLLLVSVVPLLALMLLARAEDRYWQPLVPAALLAAAWTLSRGAAQVLAPGLASRAGAWIGGALLIGAWLRPPEAPSPQPAGSTLAEFDEVARELRREAPLQYREVFRGLRGGGAQRTVLDALAFHFPADLPDGAGTERPAELAVYFPAPSAPLPPSPSWTALGSASRPIWLQRFRSWLDWDGIAYCLKTSAAERCALRPLPVDAAPGAGGVPLGSLAHRGWPNLPDMPWASGPAFRLVLRVPVRIPPGAGDRWLIAPAVPVPKVGACGGRIEDLEGLPHEGPLPATRLLLRSGDAPATGAVLLSWEFGTGICPKNAFARMIPPLSEIADADLPAFDAGVDEAERGALPWAPALGGGLALADLATAPGSPLDAEGLARLFGSEPTVPRWYVLAVALALAVGALAASAAYAWPDEEERDAT